MLTCGRQADSTEKEEALDTRCFCWMMSSITRLPDGLALRFPVMGVSICFATRIAVDVIAVTLPKAGLVTRRELQRIHPFWRFRSRVRH